MTYHSFRAADRGWLPRFRLSTLAAVACLLALGGAATTIADEPVPFEWRFDTPFVETVTTTTTIRKWSESAQQLEAFGQHAQTLTIATAPVAVDEEVPGDDPALPGVRIKQSLRRIQTHFQLPGGFEIEIDTSAAPSAEKASPAATPSAQRWDVAARKQLAALLAEPSIYRVSPLGATKKIAPLPAAAEPRAIVISAIHWDSPPSALAVEFPAAPIDVGHVWSQRRKAMLPRCGEHSIVLRYKFDRFETRSGARIAIITWTMQSSPVAANPIPATLRGEGELHFDPATGRALARSYHQRAEIGRADRPPEHREVVIEIELRAQYEDALRDEDPAAIDAGAQSAASSNSSGGAKNAE